MEYCHCGSVGAYLRSGNRLKEEELREVVSCCLLGLSYLHNRNVMHRDIKPDNLFISESGVIKLGDFGLAVLLEQFDFGRTSSRWFYVAPEVYEEEACLKSDVWSLGVSIIEMAESKNPFASCTSAQVMNMPPPSLSSSGWSSDLVDFVNACLVKDVKKRASVEELLKHPFVKDSVERIERGVKSPIIQHLKWKSCFFTTATNPNRFQYNYFAFECNKSWSMSHILKGIMRLEDGVLVEYGSGRIVWVDVNKKELLEVEGVDLSEMKRNEILDLSVEGDRWEGDVLNGNPCGWGVVYDKDNQMMYEGFRMGDVNTCYGRKYYSDISRVEYEGEWCEGLRWGRGVLFDRNGVVVYDGEWLKGDRLEKVAEIGSASVLLHNHVEELRVSDGCCNDEGLTELDLRGFVNLRELKVENECFENVKEVKLIGLSELESVEIGMNCFTKFKNTRKVTSDPNRHFFLKNCPKLKSLKMGRYSFSDYKVIEIENVNALEVIEIGYLYRDSYNFDSASLELKSILIHSE